jgi:hypothetical protein
MDGDYSGPIRGEQKGAGEKENQLLYATVVFYKAI